MVGQKLPLRCSVDYISFSAHTDYQQTSEFVRGLKPTHIVSWRTILLPNSSVLRKGRWWKVYLNGEFSLKSLQTLHRVLIFAILFEVLVHGEQNEMSRLKSALIREYEDDPDYNIDIHNPRNTSPVAFHFRGEKMAKVSRKGLQYHILIRCSTPNLLIPRHTWYDL